MENKPEYHVKVQFTINGFLQGNKMPIINDVFTQEEWVQIEDKVLEVLKKRRKND